MSMTFLFDEDGRDENVIEAFDKYRKYVNENKGNFPPSAYKLASSDWYYDFNDHKCPHDSRLEEIIISEASEGDRNEIRNTVIKVKLLGSFHDGYISLTYRNVASFRIDAFNVKDGHGDWRYDEFRLSESGLLLHEIEWCSYRPTSNWLIEAEDLEYGWSDK